MDNLESFFPVLNELSRKSGAIVRRYFGQPLEVEMKSDDTPVTKADREVEEFLRVSLEKLYPGFSIYGEEYGETDKASSHRWIIDPIDGTKSFVLKTPLFGTMIALERDGLPVLGSIYFPIQDLHLIGSAETGTFLNGERCQVSRTSRLSDATMIVTDPRSLIDHRNSPSLLKLSRKVRLVRGMGDCYGYYLVARGLADVMIEPGELAYYDVAPLHPILSGAGGHFTNLSGEVEFKSGQGLATNHLLHQEILNVIKPDKQ